MNATAAKPDEDGAPENYTSAGRVPASTLGLELTRQTIS